MVDMLQKQESMESLKNTMSRALIYELAHGFVNLVSTGPSLEVMRHYYRLESTRGNPLRPVIKIFMRVVGMYIYVLAYFLYRARKEPDKWEGFIKTLPVTFLYLAVLHTLITTREWMGLRGLLGGLLFATIEIVLARSFYLDLKCIQLQICEKDRPNPSTSP